VTTKIEKIKTGAQKPTAKLSLDGLAIHLQVIALQFVETELSLVSKNAMMAQMMIKDAI